jgi:hypothetical protein
MKLKELFKINDYERELLLKKQMFSFALEGTNGKDKQNNIK